MLLNPQALFVVPFGTLFDHIFFQATQASTGFKKSKNISRIKKTTFPHSLLILSFKRYTMGLGLILFVTHGKREPGETTH